MDSVLITWERQPELVTPQGLVGSQVNESPMIKPRGKAEHARVGQHWSQELHGKAVEASQRTRGGFLEKVQMDKL